MTKKYPTSGKRPPRVSEAKVAQSYRLSPAKIATAQAILGAPTATATIEQALDMIVFRRELIEGLGHAFGMSIAEAFPDGANGARRRR